MDFETEEQQVEAIKKWWQENSKLVIVAVVAAIAVIGGNRFYDDYRQKQRDQASSRYEHILSDVQSGKGELNQQELSVNELLAEQADTPYAALSALMLAKEQGEKGELAKAEQQLQWVMEHARQNGLRVLARLRLARLLLAAKQYDQVKPILMAEYPVSFTALFEELKGDYYVASGDTAQARAAYDKALAAASGSASPWLKMKRDDLGDEPQSQTESQPAA